MKKLENFNKEKLYIINYGVGGGYNDTDNYEVIKDTSLSNATSRAYFKAVEHYEMYEIRSIEDIIEEDEVDYCEAEQIFIDEREDRLEYNAEVYTEEKAKKYKELYHFHNPY